MKKRMNKRPTKEEEEEGGKGKKREKQSAVESLFSALLLLHAWRQGISRGGGRRR